MKRKRLTALLLSACVLVSLAGCGKKEISNEYVKIKQYKGVETEKAETAKVTEDDITNYIEAKLSENTKEVTDRELREGDIAQFNYTGKLKSNGEVFDEGTLSLGNGESYVPGFAEGIYGHKLNETFDVEVTFPEGYGGTSKPELSNAEVVFTVTITSIKEKVTSELNDEFVKSVSEKSETVEEYKKEVKKELEESNKKTAETTLRDNAWNAVMDNVEVKKYPKKRLEEKKEQIIEMMKQIMEQSYGVTYEEYLKQSGMSEEDFEKEMNNVAKENLKTILAVELIADKENLTPSDKEYKKLMEEFAEENGYPDVDTLIKQNGEDTIKEAILQNKVMDWVTDNCKQVEKKSDTKDNTKDNKTDNTKK